VRLLHGHRQRRHYPLLYHSDDGGLPAGSAITTLEGIGEPGKPHPLQRALIDEQAGQCAYCCNSMIMGAYGWLESRIAGGNTARTHGPGDKRLPVGKRNDAAVRLPVSLRRSSTDHRRHSIGGAGHGWWRPMTSANFPRRQFLSLTGMLAIGFTLAPAAGKVGASSAAASTNTMLGGNGQGDLRVNAPGAADSWLVIGSDNSITIYSGKVELGTGVQTALSQIVCEELHVSVSMVSFVQGDTSLTPDQGYTAGSQTIFTAGPVLRVAAATVFQALLAMASQAIGVPEPTLLAQDGRIGIGPNLNRGLTYGQLIGEQQIELTTNPKVAVVNPSDYKVVGAADSSRRPAGQVPRPVRICPQRCRPRHAPRACRPAFRNHRGRASGSAAKRHAGFGGPDPGRKRCPATSRPFRRTTSSQ